MKELTLFDGAFGTYFLSLHPDAGLPERANLTSPDDVAAIHREYIDSGSNAIKTNTFSVNSAFFSGEDLSKALRSGYEIAKLAAAERNVRVFADIGPISGENAEEDFLRVVSEFLSLGAENFIFETQTEVMPLAGAISLIRSARPGARVITSFAVGPDGYTRAGHGCRELFDTALGLGADTVGLNCVCGPVHILNLLRAFPSSKYPLCAMPNAGYPAALGGRTVYRDKPDYFAEKLHELHALGIYTLGGCCGTTPRHIRRFAETTGDFSPLPYPIPETKPEPSETLRRGFPRRFIAAELPAPMGCDQSELLADARKVRDAGADFATIPDSPLGKTRANSVSMAALVKRDTGLDAIPHICCRDKNQIAIKGDLLAGHIFGLRHVLAITGDPIAHTDRAEAKNVFGFNSFKLISYVSTLNENVFSDSPFTLCAGLNVSAANFDAELRRAEQKIKNGAVCMFTQPVFSEQSISNLVRAKSRLDCQIAAGIMLLAGYRNAVFMNNEVPGIEIPEALISELSGKDRETSTEICLEYARRLADRVEAFCSGFYIMTPLHRTDMTVRLIRYIKERYL